MNFRLLIGVSLVCVTIAPAADAEESDSQSLGVEVRIERLAQKLRGVQALLRDVRASGRTEHAESEISNAHARIRSALGQPVAIHVSDTPLDEVLASMQKDHGIQIRINQGALDEEGIRRNSPVSFQIEAVTLHSALTLMLRDIGLAYVVRDEVVSVTTPDDALGYVQTDAYVIGQDSLIDANELAAIIVRHIDPDSWSHVGGEGVISPVAGVLVVTQSADVHLKIERLLTQLDAKKNNR